jgi:L-fuconolactonase
MKFKGELKVCPTLPCKVNLKISHLKKIDTHQHFWKMSQDGKILDDFRGRTIQRDFLPDDISPVLNRNGFDGCVAVQINPSEKETDFLITLAKTHDFIKGVVGWVDLQADDINERLQWYKSFTLVKGFRHALEKEPSRDLMLHPRFKRGISALQRYGFSYDISINPDQLVFAADLVATYPEQKFVVDHLGKPSVKLKENAEWKTQITRLAQYPNAYCKISGLVTEADPESWRYRDFKPFIDVVVNAFGTGRIMFGSDWPISLQAARYEEVLAIVENYFSRFSPRDKELFYRQNAINFYSLQN